MIFDTVVVGGGIVGIATAWQLTRIQPGKSVAVLETSSNLASHQTGNNSGVVHSGLYYQPGSLKARNCVIGRELLYDFCEKHSIPFEKCGKLVVATNNSEIDGLNSLYERGIQNGLKGIRLISREEIHEFEPYVSGIKAIWVPETGIVSYIAVTKCLASLIQGAGGEIHTGTTFLGLTDKQGILHLETTGKSFQAKKLVNCAGLYSDRIARLCGIYPSLKIMPFRGEYYVLKPPGEHLVRNLVYPVPDPNFPFLGVHFTRMIDGTREAGPNAVLATKREGYRKRDFSLNDVLDYMGYSGFWKMSLKHWKMGIREVYRSYSKSEFLASLQRLIPSVQSGHIEPGGAGVRAQAVEPDGRLVDDFRIVRTEKMIHVLNAPSPAATACLSIGRAIAGMVFEN